MRMPLILNHQISLVSYASLHCRSFRNLDESILWQDADHASTTSMRFNRVGLFYLHQEHHWFGRITDIPYSYHEFGRG